MGIVVFGGLVPLWLGTWTLWVLLPSYVQTPTWVSAHIFASTWASGYDSYGPRRPRGGHLRQAPQNIYLPGPMRDYVLAFTRSFDDYVGILAAVFKHMLNDAESASREKTYDKAVADNLG